jgi:hypothetical protein
MKWLVSVLFLAMTAAVLAGTLFPSNQVVTPDQVLLGLFPQDSDSMIFIDVNALRNVELVEEYLDRFAVQVQDKAADFSRSTGLDPIDDVNQILLGWTGDDEFLIGLTSDYDAADLQRYLEGRGSVSEAYEDWRIYQSDAPSDWSLAFEDNLVLIGDVAAVRGALGRRGTQAPNAANNAELLTSIQSIEPGSQVWGVGRLPGAFIPEALAPPMAIDLIAALERVTYQMRVDSAVTARAVGEFADPDAAARTSDLLRGIVALAKMQVMGSEDLVRLLDGFRIDSVGSAIEVHFSADGDLLELSTEEGLPFPLLGDE